MGYDEGAMSFVGAGGDKIQNSKIPDSKIQDSRGCVGYNEIASLKALLWGAKLSPRKVEL